MMDTPQSWHILSLCLFPAINVLGITASIFLSKSKNKLPLCMGVIFSAGVLLSASLVHMLPHATENLEGFGASEEVHGSHDEAWHLLDELTLEDEGVAHEDHHDHDHRMLEEHDDDHDHAFPWANTFFAIAFLVLLCIEASMERFIDTHFSGKQGNFFHSHEDGDEEPNDHDHSKGEAANEVEPTEATEHEESHHPGPEAGCLPCDAKKVQAMYSSSEMLAEACQDLDIEIATTKRPNKSNADRSSSAWSKFAPRPSAVPYVVAPPQQPEDKTQSTSAQTINPWVSILLTLVLSIHVILEGLTIGSSNDVDTIKTTFFAVVVHKGFAAFSLGSSLVASGYWGDMEGGSKTMFFVLAGVYISVDIVALGIGMALGAAFEATGSFSGILQALLGGSFLFVSTVELIPGELEKMRRNKLPLAPLLISLLGGFTLMTILGKWV